jgi:ATP-dependent Clp protease ATP-binding subunit ClpA
MERVLSRAAELGTLHTGRPFVGTENVLRALVEDQDGIAAQVLRELGVSTHRRATGQDHELRELRDTFARRVPHTTERVAEDLGL